jgi:Na+/glutamate symporter
VVVVEEIVLLLQDEMVDQVEAVASLAHLDLVELEQLTKDILVVITTQVVVHLLEVAVVLAQLVQTDLLLEVVLNLDLVVLEQPQQYLEVV